MTEWQGDPQISLLFQLFVANQRVRALLAEAMAEAPMRADEYAVYSLVLSVGSIAPTDMARIMGMPLTTVSDYVASMVERGHARRRPNPTDLRSYSVELTRPGVAVHHEAGNAFSRAVRALRAHLDLPEAEVQAAVRHLGLAAEGALADLSAAPERRPAEA